MRLKHNKKRNIAFVYEALVRELTESVVRNNKNKQNKVVSIIKDHFCSESLLKDELSLYKSIYQTKDLEKSTAEKIMFQVKQKHETLDKKKLFQEQSALINKINKTLSNKVYNNFVPNYKTIASVYSIFQETLPVKDRVLLEENIVQQMSSSASQKLENKEPLDSLTYNTFVNSFNDEYSDALNENQKALLSSYIVSFGETQVEFKVFLNEEIGRLKKEIERVKKTSTILTSEDLKSKLESVYNVLDETKNRKIDTETVEIVLTTQELLEELKELKKNDN